MTYSLGFVKWFGGYNRNTNSENKYGFIEDSSGVDLFLHLREWREKSPPGKDQLLIYSVEEDKDKPVAINAKEFKVADHPLDQISEFIDAITERDNGQIKKRISEILNAAFCHRFSFAPSEELVFCCKQMGKEKIIDLLAGKAYWSENLSLLISLELLEPIKDVPSRYLNGSFFIKNEQAIARYLLTLEGDCARQLILPVLNAFPSSLLILCICAGIFPIKGELEGLLKKVDDYIRSLYLGTKQLPEYLSLFIDTTVKPKGGIRKIPIIGDLFDYYLFKKYLHEKNIRFLSLYESSDYLRSRLDTFILAKIFSLVLAGNPIEKVYSLFMGQLWNAITAGEINPLEQMNQQQQLFPSCSAMPKNLSCEAIYWEKRDMFLCRKRECLDPKIIPELSGPYFDYTAYEWFAHYGIAYLEERKPSSRDFPIKLAAYLNRLHEIYEILHCFTCRSLMLPDMRYSRVEYMAFEGGNLIKKDMAASYRLTVFKCPNESCSESGKGYYINHCFGYDCYNIIDTRICKVQCDSGRYICKGCGSCCEEHAKKFPVGMCPDCGAPLNLFETEKIDKHRRKDRFVKCSDQACKFMIATNKLNKKFYLDSCGPVIKLSR